MNASDKRTVLLYVEAESYVDDLKIYSFENIGSIPWWMQQQHIEQLTMQAVTNASANEDEYVKELLLTYNKIPVIIHELIIMEVWRQKLLNMMIQIHEEESDDSDLPTLAVSMAFRHEATLVTLLETILFHGECCESLQDVIVEVSDYCHRRVVQLIAIQQDKKPESDELPSAESLMSQTAKEDLERQEADIQFQICMKAISILRYICDNLENLPYALIPRFLDNCDFPMLMTNLMEDPPWQKRKITKEGKISHLLYENGRWQLVPASSFVQIGKTEAQVWMILMRLLIGTGCKYEITEMRKNRIIKLRPLLSEVKMDQIPALATFCRYLDSLVFQEPGAVTRDVLIEQVPELWTQLLADGETKGWKKLAAKLANKFFDDKEVKEQIKHWATIYDPSTWEHLLPDAPKCVVCGQEAKKKCSKCKNEWYCGRQCQVEHWPKHKKPCDLMATGAEGGEAH